MVFVAGQKPTAAELNAITTDINAVVRAWTGKAGGSDQSGISTVADITGASATWTADATRMYKTSLTVCLNKITTANAVTVYLTNAANGSISVKSTTLAINDLYTMHMEWVETGLSGTQTRKGRVETATGTVTVTNSFGRSAILIVEDIGPA